MTTDAELAYQSACAARGAPLGDLEIRFRRVFVGPELEPRKLEQAPIPHYVFRAPPSDVPAGATWLTATGENMDGGPSLSDPVAVLDLAHPHLVEDVAAIEPWWDTFRRAPLVVAELHARAAAWGLTPPRRLTWMSPRLTVSMLGSIDHDGFGRLSSAMRELCYGLAPTNDVNTMAPGDLWRVLTQHRIPWPDQTDNSYYPGIWIPDEWVGRTCAELPNPFEPLEQLKPATVVALGGDHAVLALPR